MVVYVITSGDYSDYHICAVTLEKEKAEELRKIYTDRWNEGQIEIFDTDDYYVENGRFYRVTFETHSYIKVEEILPVELKDRNKVWKLKNPKTYQTIYSVRVKAKDEEHAKKIASDLVAQYKAQEQGI